jgi:hypothetical protein
LTCISDEFHLDLHIWRVPSWPAYRTATNTEWLYQMLY